MKRTLQNSTRYLAIAISALLITICTSCDASENEVTLVETNHNSTVEDTTVKLNHARSIWQELDLKVKSLTEGLELNRDLDLMPADFAKFYAKFITDSAYQIEHIAFEEFLGIDGQCDTTIRLNAETWTVSNWDFTKFFDKENNTHEIDGWNNTFYFSPTKFYYEFYLKEIGWIYKTGFEKIKGKWQLTLYAVSSC